MVRCMFYAYSVVGERGNLETGVSGPSSITQGFSPRRDRSYLSSLIVTRQAQTETMSSTFGMLSGSGADLPDSTTKAWHKGCSPVVIGLWAYVIQDQMSIARVRCPESWPSILLIVGTIICSMSWS